MSLQNNIDTVTAYMEKVKTTFDDLKKQPVKTIITGGISYFNLFLMVFLPCLAVGLVFLIVWHNL